VAPGTDFAGYRAYAWVLAEGAPTGDPRLDNNPFLQACVQRVVDEEVTRRGFERSDAASADLFVTYRASVTRRFEAGDVSEASSCTDCAPQVYDAGTLVIEFVDARTRRLVWRGWAEGSIEGAIDNQAWLEERVTQAIGRILEQFPVRPSPRRSS
jgi:hypothetical protein